MNLSSLARKTGAQPKTAVYGPIGIDFAPDAIHAVQLCSDTDKPQHVASASIFYPGTRDEVLASPRVLSALLKKLISSADFRKRKVVIALPASEMKILPIEYKFTREELENKVILEQVKDRLPEPLTNYVIDYVPVRQDARDGQRLALVTVAERPMVMTLLNTFRKARLQPTALEIGPVAIRRLVASMFSPDDLQNILIVNIGQNLTHLTMISGRRLLMNQSIDFGQKKLLHTIASKLDLTESEALATVTRCGLAVNSDADEELIDNIRTLGLILTPDFRVIANEINQAFRYAMSVCRGATGKKVFITGSILRWPGANRLLSDLTSLEIEQLPCALVPALKLAGNQADSSEFLVATGLALRGIVPNE